MQDFFGNRPTDTSNTAIARTIEINIKQTLNEANIPQPLQAKNSIYCKKTPLKNENTN
jgi:predicted membrane chloride channel (bestrophin family)